MELAPKTVDVHQGLRDMAARYNPPQANRTDARLPANDRLLHLWPLEMPPLSADELFRRADGVEDKYPVGDLEGPTPYPPTSRYLYLEDDPEKEPAVHDWALLVVRDTQRRQTDLRGTRFSVDGAVIIDVFTLVQPRPPAESGSRASADDFFFRVKDPGLIFSHDALKIAEEFQRVYDSGVARFDGGRAILGGASINEVGVSGKWYQVRVTALFSYYQRRA